MWITHCFCSEEIWHVAILHRLPQTKLHHRKRGLPDPTNGLVCRYVIQSENIEDLRLELRLLANTDRRARPR